MVNKLECPPSSVLVDLIQGKMVDPELSALSSHLEDCSDCQAKAKTLSPYDTLTASLRGEAPAADRIAKDVPRPLIEMLKEIPKRESGVRSDHVSTSYDSARSELKFDFLAPAQQADEIGRLGRYRILKALGLGGMGAVFLADDPKLERQIALKVMLPGIAVNPTAKDRFLREARAAANLRSDHIVTIYEVDETNGVPYLAMELLAGQSLDDMIHSGQPISTVQVIHIARDIAKGLAAAHEKGLVHRDIKPGNLWVEIEPGASMTGARIKILDFGLAHVEKDDAHITRSGAIVGTPAYMAPEQARGEKAVDARADLFSLGCVLYRLCAGDIPFKAETMMGTLLAITVNDPVSLAKRNDSLPAPLSELIMQLLEKDPARRPQSARDVIARLSEIERSLSAGAIQAPSRPTGKRRPLVLAGVAFLLVALGILAGSVFFWQTPDGRVVRIECDDPAIKIALADGEFKVTGAYKEPLTFKPGKVGLRIKKGNDFEFETDKLIVNKGDKIVLRIEVVEGKVQIVQAGKGVLDSKLLPVKPAPIAVADAERRTAEWVLRLGGEVSVEVNERVINHIKDADNLPKDPFTLINANLAYKTTVTDAGLENLKGLKGLKLLNLGGTSVTDAGLIQLKEHKELTHLVLEFLKITKSGLVHVKDLQKLHVLHLHEVPVKDDWLPEIMAHHGLRELTLSYARLSESGLASLKQLKGLKLLGLRGTAANDDTLKHYQELDLIHLDLSETKLTDTGLARVKGFKGLRVLWVEKTAVSAKGLADFRAAMPACRIYHDGGILEAK